MTVTVDTIPIKIFCEDATRKSEWAWRYLTRSKLPTIRVIYGIWLMVKLMLVKSSGNWMLSLGITMTPMMINGVSNSRKIKRIEIRNGSLVFLCNQFTRGYKDAERTTATMTP